MPELLALVGLAIGTLLYALLIRRRAAIRAGALSLARALSASNDTALSRIRHGFRSAPAATGGGASPGAGLIDRRSGIDRREADDRRRGRGRRTGGDRRQGPAVF